MTVMRATRLRLLTTAAAASALLLLPAAASAAEWAPTPVTLPPGQSTGALRAVSCPTAGSCEAVGYSNGEPDLPTSVPMVVAETGGVWGQAATVSRPPGATGTTLEGVSCAAVGSCVAVGFEQAPTFYFSPKVPVIAVETDGAWGQTVQIKPPDNATYAILTGVSCPSVGNCMAVGGDEFGPFGIAETDGTWGAAVQIPPDAPATGEPASPDPFTFDGVSCAAVGACVGVGVTWNAAGEKVAGAATTTAGNWGEATPIAAPSSPASLTSVSCAAVGACSAVGTAAGVPFAVADSGGAWGGATPLALPAGARYGILPGISCPIAGYCLAVGVTFSASNPNEVRPMIVGEAGGAWGAIVPLAAPAGALNTTLNGVSCTAAGPCEAVGSTGEGNVTAQQPVAYGGELALPGSPPAPTPGGSGPPSIKVTTIGSPGGGSATACAVTLGATSIPVTKAHVAEVPLADTGTGACSGTVTLSVKVKAKSKGKKAKGKRKAKVRKLASGPLRLAPGEKATIGLHLNGAGKSALAKAKGALRASLTVQAGEAQVVEGVRLRRPAKRKHAAR
jgi:hypothetical protein